jgi:hypothetical protein
VCSVVSTCIQATKEEEEKKQHCQAVAAFPGRSSSRPADENTISRSVSLYRTQCRIMTQSLCGSFLTDKRSLLAFTWTITTVLTLVAFISSLAMMVRVHTHERRLEYYYEQQYQYSQSQYQNNNNNNQQQQQGAGAEGNNNNNNNSGDRQIAEYLALTKMYSGSITFVALYTMAMAIALSLYGSTAIVGFTSLRGVYIGPCFSTSSGASMRLKLGVFGGAIVFFANILLVCAVIFGEVRVS